MPFHYAEGCLDTFWCAKLTYARVRVIRTGRRGGLVALGGCNTATAMKLAAVLRNAAGQ